jgi:hypothetical protein
MSSTDVLNHSEIKDSVSVQTKDVQVKKGAGYMVAVELLIGVVLLIVIAYKLIFG